MQKLLIVCGPTGTGKTNLGLFLAKKFNGEIISADSKQVYKDLNIGTGKDLPHAIKLKDGCYEMDGVKIWGYDLVDPKENFSVAQYLDFFDACVKQIIKRGKLPIVVGGTGFYIKAITDGIGTVAVPQNLPLRQSLDTKTPEQLFDILAQFDPVKAASMNQSDKKNPRRLIRAIEVAQDKTKNVIKATPSKFGYLLIGLTTAKQYLENRVEQRVLERANQGIEGEINDLLSMGVTWNDQAMTSMGYVEWKDYFLNHKPKSEVIAEWIKDEKNYIKKQLTWFKKEKRINWVDILDSNYKEKVESLVQKWYKQD